MRGLCHFDRMMFNQLIVMIVICDAIVHVPRQFPDHTHDSQKQCAFPEDHKTTH